MKHDIPRWQIAGFLFTSVAGTFLHFLFDLTGQSLPAALVSAVNESIWEHLKLLFYPMVLFAVAEFGVWGRARQDFWSVKLAGILLALAVTPVIYYTYTGIGGKNVDAVNIAIFFLAAGLGYWAETKLFAREKTGSIPSPVAVGVLVALAALFTVFTFLPPQIPLFQDPLSDSFGFQA